MDPRDRLADFPPVHRDRDADGRTIAEIVDDEIEVEADTLALLAEM